VENALGEVQSVLVLGGGSDIALATVRRLIGRGARTVVLAARRPDELAPIVEELHTLGATTVEAITFDATATATHEALVDDAFDRHGDFDIVLIAFGVLGDQAEAERDAAAAVDVGTVNYLGSVSVGLLVAKRLRAQGHGRLVVLSSVSGERARRANFVYGSSKAGFDAFFQGLGDSLVGSGVGVTIVRPGYVHTKMTEGRDVVPMSSTPEQVADGILKGLARGAEIIWVPPLLRYAMSALRHLPRPLFRRLPY
jgi:decaprenylphospho-beta-D-erythro-pentofuranosid-2-ulose 2-reductase